MLQSEECPPGKAKGRLSKGGGAPCPLMERKGPIWGKLTGGNVLC